MGLSYLFYITIIFVILSFILFEYTTDKIEILVLVATLSALASVGRIIFSSVPSVQPSTFIIICSGFMLSPISALAIGIVTALSSSIILGFGTYTFYQAFLWGVIGLLSSLLKKVFLGKDNKVRLPLIILYSILLGEIFGLIMNLSHFSFMNIPFNLKTYISLCIISLPMDLMHGLSTSILFIICGNSFINILQRVCRKYDL